MYKIFSSCTKVCYTFAPAYINYTRGQSQIAKCSNRKKLIAYLQASKLPPQQQQTNRKLISSLTKFLFSELACVSPGYYLSSRISHLVSHLSVLSDRLGFHVDVPQKAFKKFLITPNLKQLMNASLGPPHALTPTPALIDPQPDMGNQHSLKRNLQLVGPPCRRWQRSVCKRGQFLFPSRPALPRPALFTALLILWHSTCYKSLLVRFANVFQTADRKNSIKKNILNTHTRVCSQTELRMLFSLASASENENILFLI